MIYTRFGTPVTIIRGIEEDKGSSAFDAKSRTMQFVLCRQENGDEVEYAVHELRADGGLNEIMQAIEALEIEAKREAENNPAFSDQEIKTLLDAVQHQLMSIPIRAVPKPDEVSTKKALQDIEQRLMETLTVRLDNQKPIKVIEPSVKPPYLPDAGIKDSSTLSSDVSLFKALRDVAKNGGSHDFKLYQAVQFYFDLPSMRKRPRACLAICAMNQLGLIQPQDLEKYDHQDYFHDKGVFTQDMVALAFEKIYGSDATYKATDLIAWWDDGHGVERIIDGLSDDEKAWELYNNFDKNGFGEEWFSSDDHE